eukprot:TRINITY_DN32912_c0_g1_i1.p1 TRINITY_DN32912_c0_g1~~TRINITY_DN32912_c0_g1_i1.p1  ORF type:complete len:427 (-),score=97.88 TRINITY_DN32912_c0_g1_i1:49-1236(-)
MAEKRAKKLAEIEKLKSRRGIGSPTPVSNTDSKDDAQPVPSENDKDENENKTEEQNEAPKVDPTASSSSSSSSTSAQQPQPEEDSEDLLATKSSSMQVDEEAKDKTKQDETKDAPTPMEEDGKAAPKETPKEKKEAAANSTEQNADAETNGDTKEQEEDKDEKDDKDDVDEDKEEEQDAQGDRTGGLTTAEIKERKQLLEAGFSNWSKADYSAFVRAVCNFGRNNVKSIAESLADIKTAEEVEAYSTAFWRFGRTQCPHWEKELKKIQKGEELLKKHHSLTEALQWRAQQLKQRPYNYDCEKKGLSLWDEDHDRYLLLFAAETPYGQWGDLTVPLMQKAPQHTFDWMAHSRTPQELNRRVLQLIKMAETQKAGADKEKSEKRTTRGRKKQTVPPQ